jgi:hypothetical protein
MFPYRIVLLRKKNSPDPAMRNENWTLFHLWGDLDYMAIAKFENLNSLLPIKSSHSAFRALGLPVHQVNFWLDTEIPLKNVKFLAVATILSTQGASSKPRLELDYGEIYTSRLTLGCEQSVMLYIARGSDDLSNCISEYAGVVSGIRNEQSCGRVISYIGTPLKGFVGSK